MLPELRSEAIRRFPIKRVVVPQTVGCPGSSEHEFTTVFEPAEAGGFIPTIQP
jgi:hypothetical protein